MSEELSADLGADFKEAPLYALFCEANNRYVRAAPDRHDQLFADGTSRDEWCLFQFVPIDGKIWRIWSVGKRFYVSGYGNMPGGPGNGWPLRALVDDDNWAWFRLEKRPKGKLLITLAQPPVPEAQHPRNTVTRSIGGGEEVFIGHTAGPEQSEFRLERVRIS